MAMIQFFTVFIRNCDESSKSTIYREFATTESAFDTAVKYVELIQDGEYDPENVGVFGWSWNAGYKAVGPLAGVAPVSWFGYDESKNELLRRAMNAAAFNHVRESFGQ